MLKVQVHNSGERKQSNGVLITERIPPRHVDSRTYDIFYHIEEPTRRNSKRGRDSASLLYCLAMTLDLSKHLSVVDVIGLLRLFIEDFSAKASRRQLSRYKWSQPKRKVFTNCPRDSQHRN